MGIESVKNNMSPKISIIIPVYNVVDYIEECLQSVMNQTYKGEMECLLVDDCGTDNSMDVVERLLADYDGPMVFRVLHHERNRGLSAARNTGTEAATGDYVFYLDSDDYISVDCIEVLTAPIMDREYDMVLGDVELSSNPQNIVLLPKETGPVLGRNQIFCDFFVTPVLYVAAWNKLVKTSLFKNNDLSFLEGQLNEDDLWRYKCCQCMQSLFVQKKITYHYRVRNESITSDYIRHPEKRLDSYFKTVDYVLSNPAMAGKEIWEKIIVYFMCVCSRLIIISGVDCREKYLGLRRRFNYCPLRSWFKEGVSKADVKHQFHLLLSPILGYYYLRFVGVLRRVKYIKNK